METSEILSSTENVKTISNYNVKRIKYIDIMKGVAIICVVLCHAVESAYSGAEWIALSNMSKIFKITIFTIGRIGVPLFVLASGVLLLNKKFENENDIIKFYKRNLVPLLIVTEIWNTIYYIFMKVWYSQEFEIKEFVEILLFLKNSNSPNMWYMPMILGMYIVVPFLSIIVHKFSLKEIKIPLIVGIICSTLIPSLSVILSYRIPTSTVINTAFLGGVYGIYLVLGYYMDKINILDKISTLKMIFILIIELCITVASQIILLNKGVNYNLWYNFLPLVILAFTVFILLKRLKNINEKIYAIFYKLSTQTLAIFFIHMLIKYIVQSYINSFNIINPVKTIILFVVIFVFTLIVIEITRKNNLIRKFLLFIK